MRRRDLVLGAILAAMATAAAVAVPLGYGGVVNGTWLFVELAGGRQAPPVLLLAGKTLLSRYDAHIHNPHDAPHSPVLLLPTDTPLAVRRQQLVRSLQVSPYP